MTEPPPAGSADQLVERRIVTVLFADLVGFTTLSEQLDAEDVATIQDAYFAMVRETVGRYGGRLEKFIGDAAMAVFGVPRSRDDDAERAVRAGLALVGGIQQIGARLGLDEGALRLRVGVNTGEAVAAAGGPDEGRVTGDTVNTAARLQTAAAPMSVVVGEQTALAVADVAELESMGGLELKGKAEPVPAWRVEGLRAEPSRELAMGALRAPTLGRATELAALKDAWQRVMAGAVERWLIVAPPGVGKSRLLRQLADDLVAMTPDIRIWRTRCRPDVVSAFDPIARLLLDALGTDAASARDVLWAALRRAGSSELRAGVVIDAVLSVIGSGPREGSAGDDRDALFDALLGALDALAAGKPVLWLVEDVHWAGGDVLSFLALAGRRRTATGRLLLATCRPSLLETNPDWTAPDPAAGRQLLRLATLQPEDAQALVGALVGDALPTPLVEQIAARSDGNCLFIEELLRTWVSVGTLLPVIAGGWRLAVAADEIPLPTSVQSIYAAQLDDLPPQARLLARRASVAGRRFPVQALEALGAAGAGDGASEGLEPLRRRDLVTGPLSEPVVGDAFAYRHALLRDAGYASLARAERPRLHVRLARWLEEAAADHGAEVAEAIAGHYAAALDSAPALARELDEGLDRTTVQRLAADWFERAGAAALALSATDAARTLFRRAIDLTAEDALLVRARRWEQLADATARAADMDEGAAAYERSIELYRAAVSAGSGAAAVEARNGMASAVYSLCAVWYDQLRFAESRDLAARVMNELGEVDPTSMARLVMSRALGGLGAAGPSPDTGPELERAVALAQAGGDETVQLRALTSVTVFRNETGLIEPGEWERVEAMALAMGAWPTAIDAVTNRSFAFLDDDAQKVFPLAARAREMADAHGRIEDVGWADYVAAEAAFVLGDWDRAHETGLRAVNLGEANAYRRLTVRTWHVLVPIATVRGDRALLERCFRWYEALSGPFPDSPYARVMRPAQDLAFAEAGLRPEVRLEVEPRIPSYQDEPGGPSWTAAADRVFLSWLEQGNVDGAARIVAAMTDALPRYRPSSLGRGTYELLRGRLALAQGDRSAGQAAALAALDRFRVSGAPWWMAKAIRLALRAGLADETLENEVARIERGLGAVAPTA